MEEKYDYKTSWIMIQKAFPILCDAYSLPFPMNVKESEFVDIAKIIHSFGLTEVIQNLLVNRIEKHIREIVAPEFWAYFKNHDSDFEAFRNFYCAVELLYEYYIQFTALAYRIDHLRTTLNFTKHIYHEDKAEEALKMIFRAVLLSQMPLDYKDTVQGFYQIALRLEDKEVFIVDNNCSVCHQETCLCLQYFNETNEKLVNLGLIEPLIGQILTSMIYVYIENHVEKSCKDNFDSSFIEPLEQWLYNVVIPWLNKIYFCVSTGGDKIFKLTKKLLNFLYETYTKVRIEQLFNIIIEYPESLPALEDLRVCLPKTDLRSLLTKKLQKAMETRLLHPGVSTPDILTAYVAAIRSMRVLDPSGLLLETITQPVHQYLRSREDTVRCVVSSLTEEGPNDLAEELVRGEGVQVDENTPAEEDYENWENWMPDPIDADPQKSLSSRRSNDIISMLVNVYGSKELFVNEYRTLLADRLLSQLTCDTEKEIRYLELLKLRFGDSQLHYCEVMLKDIADSKRITHHIKQDPEYIETEVPTNAMVVSAQFWPAFKDEKLELHPKIDEQLEKYTRAFEMLKGNRTLSWKKHLGIVDLEIELPDRTLNFSVTPVHATIIMHFQDKPLWPLTELSRLMQVPSTILRRKIGFWQSHGLITETVQDVFQLVEEGEEQVGNQSVDIIVEEESESAMASAQDQREEELQTIWSYIIGMLMNLDSMPLERIHQMLKMFAFQGPTIECNLAELRQFLERKVREHQLVYSAGLYRLPKP